MMMMMMRVCVSGCRLKLKLLTILLPQPTEYWDYKHESPHLAINIYYLSLFCCSS